MFAEDRKVVRAKQLSVEYHGILQVDGCVAFNGLIKNGGSLVQLAFCFAHARRKFSEVHAAAKPPIAAEAPQRIAIFDAIEDRMPGSAGGALSCGAANRHQAAVRGLQNFAPGATAGSLEAVRSGQNHALHYEPFGRLNVFRR
nr:transposase [Bradyrhizobium sp. 150]